MDEIKQSFVNRWQFTCHETLEILENLDNEQQVYEGKGMNVLRRTDGSWRIVHEHVSKEGS